MKKQGQKNDAAHERDKQHKGAESAKIVSHLLRSYYDELRDEPISPQLLELLEKLEKVEKAASTGSSNSKTKSEE